MRDIFECRNDSEYAIYIDKHLADYQKNGGRFLQPEVVYRYFRVLMHYVFLVRPKSERNIGSVLKLMGASYKEKGYRTAFWAIIRDAAEEYPSDTLFYSARKLEQEFGNDDLDECFDFMEYELKRNGELHAVEEDLGNLAVCRIRYQQNRVKSIRMPSRKEKKKGEPAYLVECRRFLEEYTPRRIKEYLDRFVLGQEESKIVLSTAVYNHFLRIVHPEENLIKTNVLLVGPSGCGKTELIRRIANLIPLPVVITDFSGIVATPWKGRNKEESLLNLYIKAGKDQDLTECGIVFCDEFDKIIPSKLYSKGGDINQELQGQLLGMFEGTDLDVPLPDRSGGPENLILNTKNILFVCAGAFEGLDPIVKKDYVKSGIGFGSEMEADANFEMTGEKLKTEHLIEYGMKPELAGRLSAVTVLKKLDREMLKRVLIEPEDSIISRYQKELQVEDDVELRFTDEALDVIIERVMDMSIGARALNAVVHEILKDVLFEVPSMPGVREVLITGGAARMEEKAVYH